MNFLSKTAKQILRPASYLKDVSSMLLHGKKYVFENTPEEKVNSYQLKDRGISLTDKDFELLKPILFSEISNRDTTKKELESRVILNTSLNRLKEHRAKGKEMSLTDVFTEKNQYQGYNSPQYQKYVSGNLDELGKKKADEINMLADKMIGEVKGGAFADNSNGAYYYIHNPDQTIAFDDSRKLYK